MFISGLYHNEGMILLLGSHIGKPKLLFKII